LTENAAEIRKLAVDLYERLATYTGHINDMGKKLEGAFKSYNQSIRSLETRVLPSARRFTELGIQPRKGIPTTEAIETAPLEGIPELKDKDS
jgi:DNA recombination protein RmuC